MSENRVPIFISGRVLSKQSLDLLRDNPTKSIQGIYADCTNNAIISGMNIEVEDNTINISDGVVKIEEQIHIINGMGEIELPDKEDKYIIKLHISRHFDDNATHRIFKYIIIFATDESLEDNEIELGRITIREGATQSSDSINFDEYNQEYNKIILTNVVYLSKDINGTLHKKITEEWAKQILSKDDIDIHDISIARLALNGIVSRKNLIEYINRKLNKDDEEYTNEEMFKALSFILNNKKRKIKEIDMEVQDFFEKIRME